MTIWKKETASRPNLEYLRTEITELNLGVRSYNCLKRAGCNTVGDILRLIEADENGGGLLLSSGCDLPAGSPIANVHAMVKAAEDFAEAHK